MSPDRGDADRLNDRLDAAVTGDVTRSNDLDPVIGATVQDFFAADDSPGPPPGLAQHIWDELMDRTAPVELVPLIPASPPAPNGHHRFSIGQTAPPKRGPSALTYLATAALVLLSLVGGFVAIRGSLHLLGPENPAVVIPAIDDPPETVLAPDSSADVVLLRATLDQPPAEGTPRIALQRITLQPGASQSVGAQSDTGVGTAVFTVESGQITVETDAPVFVSRAVTRVGPPSLVQPGTIVSLDPGDQLHAPSGATFSRHNDGSSPATLLSFTTGGENASTTTSPPDGVTYSAGLPSEQLLDFPATPAEATVHRRTLPPGAEIAVRDVPGLQLVFVETGGLDLVYADAGTAPTSEHVVTIPAGTGTGTFGPTPDQAVLANRGDEPLVILTASVVATSPGAQTPEASWTDGWGTGDQMH